MPRTHTQAERDAMTVEIMFAVVTGAVLGAVVFLALASPALLGDLPRGEEQLLFKAAAVTAAAAFVVRVVRVLWRQPSQPGRTRPDS
ncbi:DUF6332 family protein [Streptomyces sp. NPDC004647]|uniref:DUF6332 family protein n=1 Tax=Streptomyces sp. NPDC004647 TaxID=3154671 RepID=UPI0033BBF353